jgi:hypothetical protein
MRRRRTLVIIIIVATAMVIIAALVAVNLIDHCGSSQTWTVHGCWPRPSGAASDSEANIRWVMSLIALF